MFIENILKGIGFAMGLVFCLTVIIGIFTVILLWLVRDTDGLQKKDGKLD